MSCSSNFCHISSRFSLFFCFIISCDGDNIVDDPEAAGSCLRQITSAVLLDSNVNGVAGSDCSGIDVGCCCCDVMYVR